MQEWLNWHAWKACVPLKGTMGSNPILSANHRWPRESEAFFDGVKRVCTAGTSEFYSIKKAPE